MDCKIGPYAVTARIQVLRKEKIICCLRADRFLSARVSDDFLKLHVVFKVANTGLDFLAPPFLVMKKGG